MLTKSLHFNILKGLMATKIKFIDIFSIYNEIDESVIETLLEDCSISYSIRHLGPGRFAPDLDDVSEKRVAVEEGQVDYARRLITEAIRSGVISRDGRFNE